MSQSPKNCPFCAILKKQEAKKRKYQYWTVIEDDYPVTEGHLLIIPNRHVAPFEGLLDAEFKELMVVIRDVSTIAKMTRSGPFRDVDGWNIGVNVGEAAGQTVGHLHVHVIPRRNGDMKHPEGGVRGVIPSKQKYGRHVRFIDRILNPVLRFLGR